MAGFRRNEGSDSYLLSFPAPASHLLFGSSQFPLLPHFLLPLSSVLEMGWSHPDISLDDLLVLIKGFVDILVLASGYQSSGQPAIWDVENIKKAVRWGLFFEDVFKRLGDSVDCEESVNELDTALLELNSSSLIPHGLVHLSSAALSRARDLILQHFLQAHPLKDAHLFALLTAVIGMDINEVDETNIVPNVYIDRLIQQMESLNSIQERGAMRGSTTSSSIMDMKNTDGRCQRVYNHRSPYIVSDFKTKECMDVSSSCFVIQELLKREASMLCISSVETGLNDIWKMINKDFLVGSKNNPVEGQPSTCISLGNEALTEIFLWDQWRSRSLAYMLDNRTIRLLSGANLIFGSPKVQWIRVFELLIASTETHNDNVLESMEILLLGFISRRWNHLIECFMSDSCHLLPISKQFSDVYNLLQGNSRYLDSEKEVLNLKEKDILEYLTPLVHTQPQKLWHLPPVLVAAVIPSWSTLFMMYMDEIERQLNGVSSSFRCCVCSQTGIEHRDCELAERIWCLYVFHIQGYPLVR